MKRIALFVLTAFVVTALVLALSPVSARADKDLFPTGTYTTAITLADVSKYGLPSPYPEILVGYWKMSFGENGSFEIQKLGTDLSAHGTYMANPTVLIFGEDTGELACIPPGHAAYKWFVSGDTLLITGASEQNDRCWGRYIVSTSHPLVKQP